MYQLLKILHEAHQKGIFHRDINHNNMTAFFSNNTNGSLNNYNHKSILDSYTGSGTYDIEKNEVAQLFKPSENTQLVYGSQNQNDFLQSRVNQSLRHANSKPWESVQVGPGLNQGYEGGPSELGFNNGMESRDSWKPKTVDELRAENNPKMVYRLDNHMGPALQPVQNAPDWALIWFQSFEMPCTVARWAVCQDSGEN